MLLLNVATTIKAPLLGLLASFAVSGPIAAGATARASEAPAEAIAIETLHWAQDFPRGGGLDGISETFAAGQDCGGMQRTRAEASIVNGKGTCVLVGWVSEDPTDCRVHVHVEIAAFGWAVCRVQVFVEQ